MGNTFRGVFMENLELTNMVMIVNEKDNKVLVQNRIKGEWTGIAFPGGHVEKGESIIDSAIREVKEELDLDLSPKDATFVGETRRFFKSIQPDRNQETDILI